MNAVTHSYTIMPIVSMAGELIEPVFICLQEPTGKLGPRVNNQFIKRVIFMLAVVRVEN